MSLETNKPKLTECKDIPKLLIIFCLSPHCPGIWDPYNAHLPSETLRLSTQLDRVGLTVGLGTLGHSI